MQAPTSGIEVFIMGFWAVVFLSVLLEFFKSIRLVPTQKAFLVERLGKYSQTLGPGFHALVPYFDKVSYIRSLKEMAIDVPPQFCFSKDEINVEVDGVLYMSIIDPVKASYGITNYKEAAVQLAQTTTRSVIGTIDLDRTFEEREVISARVVDVINRAGETWGVRIQRYEIRNITPPKSVQNAMEKQVTAERNMRAILAESEGKKQSMINTSEGDMSEMINVSEGEKQRRINEAQGKASEILAIAGATAESIEKIAAVISTESGEAALNMQLSERMFGKLSGLAQKTTKVILPANLAEYSGWIQNLGLGNGGVSQNLVVNPIETESGLRVYCPECSTPYKIESVLKDKKKFDLDPEEPGIQLQCKKCSCSFSVKG